MRISIGESYAEVMLDPEYLEEVKRQLPLLNFGRVDIYELRPLKTRLLSLKPSEGISEHLPKDPGVVPDEPPCFLSMYSTGLRPWYCRLSK